MHVEALHDEAVGFKVGRDGDAEEHDEHAEDDAVVQSGLPVWPRQRLIAGLHHVGGNSGLQQEVHMHPHVGVDLEQLSCARHHKVRTETGGGDFLLLVVALGIGRGGVVVGGIHPYRPILPYKLQTVLSEVHYSHDVDLARRVGTQNGGVALEHLEAMTFADGA